MDLQKIEQILELIDRTGFWETAIRDGDFEIKVRKTPPPQPVQMVGSGAQVAPQTTQPAPSVKETVGDDKHIITKSSLVGTFYRSSKPDAPPFVEIGNTVKRGQILCVVGAMKMMNSIESEVDGKIVAIYVEDNTPVEYGESLFLIEVATLH